MDTRSRWVVSISDAINLDTGIIGGKGAKLSRLIAAGFRVPKGFCITVSAYEHFLSENHLANVIQMELGRKPLATMRYEEIWDAALRIRSAFLSAPVPEIISEAVLRHWETVGRKPLAVRSSAPKEDSAKASFAGLHESVIDVMGYKALLNAIRIVWASLWSDAALLYQRELALDPSTSRMAVVVQEMIDASCSGVAFGRDPRAPLADRAIIEAVPGKCRNLVDGLVDPDRWILKRSTGEVLEWRSGNRDNRLPLHPLLNYGDIKTLFRALNSAENFFGWPPDMEWTDKGEFLTILQVRPISTVAAKTDGSDKRNWYLTLRPKYGHLRKMAVRVSEELIPELEREGNRFDAEAIEEFDDIRLAAAIEERFASVKKWKKIYWEDFIPFAHGVRQLGIYYNDAVQPDDPYEFVELLRGENMLVFQRNQMFQDLTEKLKKNALLHQKLRQAMSSESGGRKQSWARISSAVRSVAEGDSFIKKFEELMNRHMNIAYGSARLKEHPELLLNTILAMAQNTKKRTAQLDKSTADLKVEQLEAKLLDAVGTARHDEARELIMIGRLSWRLRDDDNILLSRLESQLLRSLQLAARRLRAAGRLSHHASIGENAAVMIAEALRNPKIKTVKLPEEAKTVDRQSSLSLEGKPRQLTGQPGSPGIASGKVKRIITLDDLGRFKEGNILVCDAVQPTMTHLVPLAAAIVERRGGMLIHSAIIARELGIPCINGIENVVELLHDGDWVTVDGYLGILTIGSPEFDLELG